MILRSTTPITGEEKSGGGKGDPPPADSVTDDTVGPEEEFHQMAGLGSPNGPAYNRKKHMSFELLFCFAIGSVFDTRAPFCY